MLKIDLSNRFKKDLKRYEHNKKVQLELDAILKLLLNKKELPEKYSDHPLTGDYSRYRECHLRPDVLLVYRLTHTHIYLARIGSHSELF